MKIHLYNAKTDSFREATIIPSNSWGGKTLLGASIRFCQYTGAADRVWHVLETKPNSPAQKAGLVSGKGSEEFQIVHNLCRLDNWIT